jgi:Family of unknown function (DUF5677)
MNFLEKIFDQLTEESFSLSYVGARILKRKLEQEGIIIDDNQVASFEMQFQNISIKSSGSEKFSIELDDEQLKILKIGDNESFVIDIGDSESEIEEIKRVFLERTNEAFPELINELSDSMLENLNQKRQLYLRNRKREKEKFEKRLRQQWEIPLDLFEMHLHIALEAGDEYNREFRQRASENQDHVFEVLTRLHARACQICSEILTLLRSGHADGAHARWRTLHEIAVVGSFVKSHGEETAEKYLLHEAIESFKAAKLDRRYAERIGYEYVSQEEYGYIEGVYKELVARFGLAYRTDYGWAASELNKDRPSFRDIEEEVGLDYLRPFYKMASHNVHANPKGILFKLGLYNNDRDILLAGPSNTGLTDPAHSAAISLGQITTNLLTMDSNLDRLVICSMLLKLQRRIGDEFLKVQNVIEENESKLRGMDDEK